MKLLDYPIQLKNGTDRVEIFPFGDCHIGKVNCNEGAIKKQVAEVVARRKKPGREVRVIFGGDICDCVKPGDLKRYNTNTLPDWMFKGDADTIKARLADVITQQRKRALSIFSPVKDIAIGAIEGNHEYSMFHSNNRDFQAEFCESMGIPDLTDEAYIRLQFKGPYRRSSVVKLYIQHGHGGGRTAGSEPGHLDRMQKDWSDADICLRGHSHTFHILPPKATPYLPPAGSLPSHILTRYAHAANWGAWLNSHHTGRSTYESRATYPTRPMMTIKLVIWPFHRICEGGMDKVVPKIEIRNYAIL